MIFFVNWACCPSIWQVRTQSLKKLMKQREGSYRELAERMARADKLKRIMAHKQLEKTLMSSKGKKRKVKDAEGGAPAVYKWKRQRAK